jgi:hypothetical protein
VETYEKNKEEYLLLTNPTLIGYTDAGYLSDPHNARSQTGFVFLQGGTTISLKSSRQTLVVSHPAIRNKARCISYMRQEDNTYNNRVYRDKCHKTSECLLHSGRLITK